MEISKSKLKAMLRYFCSNTEPHLLGKTKLMKLFYFADFLHIKRYGHPITYDTYYHLEHGPIPTTVLNLINEVADNPETGLLSDTIKVVREDGTTLQRISCFKKFSENDEQYFSEQELLTLKDVCTKFGEKSAKFLEDISHNESPWLKTRDLDEISYELAAQDSDSKVDVKVIKFFKKLQNL